MTSLPEGTHIQAKGFQSGIVVNVFHVQDLDGHVAMPIALIDCEDERTR